MYIVYIENIVTQVKPKRNRKKSSSLTQELLHNVANPNYKFSQGDSIKSTPFDQYIASTLNASQKIHWF